MLYVQIFWIDYKTKPDIICYFYWKLQMKKWIFILLLNTPTDCFNTKANHHAAIHSSLGIMLYLISACYSRRKSASPRGMASDDAYHPFCLRRIYYIRLREFPKDIHLEKPMISILVYTAYKLWWSTTKIQGYKQMHAYRSKWLDRGVLVSSEYRPPGYLLSFLCFIFVCRDVCSGQSLGDITTHSTILNMGDCQRMTQPR